MSNTVVYKTFFEAVQESISKKTFAKLTLAKTIGKPELQNLYVKLILEENSLKCTFTKKIYDGEKKEIVSVHEIVNLEVELTPYLTNPFFSALLFTTEADVTLKINNKKAASIVEKAPVFKNAATVFTDNLTP